MRSPVRLLAAAAPSGLPGARRVLRSGLAQLFGPPPFDPDRDPGDPGLCGPGSASWRIIAEPAAIVGGIRALLVQLLHPLAMAGVADHSAFRTDPLGRLHRTAAYVTATTFGSTREALAIARRVRQAHTTVVGTAPDGRAYRAADPELLTWVSVALTSSFLATDAAFAPVPADRAAADAFVAEQSRAAALLDERVDLDDLDPADVRAGRLDLPLLADGLLPLSASALRGRLDAFGSDLAVGDQAREALRFLVWPDLPPAVRTGYLPLLAGAIACLDPDQRRLLGFPSSRLAAAPVQAQTRLLLALMRIVSGTSPSARLAARRAAA